MRNSAINWNSYSLDQRRLERLLPSSLRLRAALGVLERNLHRQAHLTTSLRAISSLLDHVEQEQAIAKGHDDARQAREVLF